MVQKTRKRQLKRKAKKSTKKTKKSFKQRLLKFLFISLTALFLMLAAFIFYCYKTLPDIEVALSKTRQPSTTIISDNIPGVPGVGPKTATKFKRSDIHFRALFT